MPLRNFILSSKQVASPMWSVRCRPPCSELVQTLA